MALAPTGVWFDSGCGGPKARWRSDGSIETTAVLPPREFPSAVSKWKSLIQSAAAKHGVQPAFVAGVMATESGGNQFAATYCCFGLMGFLPATATFMAGRQVSKDELLNNPALSVDLGAKLIAYLMDKYGNNPIKTAAAYNAGSVKCGAPGKCPNAPNQWNVISDCAQGKAVDYPGRIITYTNQAASMGFGSGAGASSKPSTSPIVFLGIGALAVGAYLMRKKAA